MAGDKSPDGKGVLALQRGIEVGHVFYLGRKYSESMHATFLDENGKPQFIEMGCYGIGVTRLLGAAIEQRHDEKGILWPVQIAPFDALEKEGIDVMLDDRDLRAGVMFADWELIGVPHRIVIGERGLKTGELEYTARDAMDKKTMIAEDKTVDFLVKKILG